MVSLSAGTGQAVCGNGWDWSKFLQVWVGFINFSVGMGGRGLLNILLRLVKILVEAGRIAQTVCGSGWDCSNFLQD